MDDLDRRAGDALLEPGLQGRIRRNGRAVRLLAVVAVTFFISVAVTWEIKVIGTQPSLGFIFAYLIIYPLLIADLIIGAAAAVMLLLGRRWWSLVLFGVSAAMIAGVVVGGRTGAGYQMGVNRAAQVTLDVLAPEASSAIASGTCHAEDNGDRIIGVKVDEPIELGGHHMALYLEPGRPFGRSTYVSLHQWDSPPFSYRSTRGGRVEDHLGHNAMSGDVVFHGLPLDWNEKALSVPPAPTSIELRVRWSCGDVLP